MRGLNGFLKRILLISNILVLPFLLTLPSSAQQPFTVFSDYYHVWDGREINSTIYLTITSETESKLITYYTITIPDKDILPKVYSVNRDVELEPTVHRRDGLTDLVINLENTPISPQKPITLKLTYTQSNTSNDLSLLSSVSDTQVRSFKFTYPSSKGDITWSSAPVVDVKSVANNFEVTTSVPKTDTVRILLGEEVTYEYTIKKNLTNSGNEIIFSEIVLPINNSKQHILVDSVKPTPDKTYKDTDGNYILQYSIAPQSNIEVDIKGYILMNNSTYPYPLTYLIENNPIWQINDISLIRHINRYLQEYGIDVPDTFSNINALQNTEQKELLYNGIYQYCIDNLQPNTLTIGSLTGAERLNGQEVLIKQDLTTSEGYTDALISMYRYYGIPARMVVGYVSEMSNFTTVGIYHYWAEYFDKELNDWIPVDPFLEDYSNTTLLGRDMKDHIALIYRYSNPNTPKLPYFSSEDLNIKKTENSIPAIHDFQLDFIFEPYKISNPYLKGSIGIVNTGNTILDMFNISQSNPNLNEYIDYIENNSQNILLPKDTYQIKFNIPSNDIEERIFAVLNALSGTELIEDKMVEESIGVVEDNRDLDLLVKALSILLFSTFLLLCSYIFLKRKKI